MERPLLKLYIIMAVGLALAIVCVPGIVTRTSDWIANAAIKARLLAYRGYAYEPLKAYGQRENGVVIIVMDAGWETQYTNGYRILKQYGMKGCVSVVPAAVGTPGYMDYKQLAELYTDGWDLLNHTYNHTGLVNRPRSEQADQVNRARKWLRDHLMDRGSDIVVFPGGACTQDLIRMLEEEGYAAARSLKSLWSAKAGATLEDAEICNLISSMAFVTVRDAMDRAARNKSAVILTLNKIEPVTDDTQMQVEEHFFLRIVEYLYNNSDAIDVMTMTEFLATRPD